MTERVEARPGRVYLLDQRLELTAAQVAGLDRVAVPVGEHERRRVLIVQRGEIGAQAVDEGAGNRISRLPYFVFGGSIRPLTIAQRTQTSGAEPSICK
jgi:hypothetical protein